MSKSHLYMYVYSNEIYWESDIFDKICSKNISQDCFIMVLYKKGDRLATFSWYVIHSSHQLYIYIAFEAVSVQQK